MSEEDAFDWEQYARKAGFESLQEMKDYHQARNDEIEAVVKQGVGGVIPCKACQADAKWQRDGQRWSAKCSTCAWEIFGQIPIDEVPSALN